MFVSRLVGCKGRGGFSVKRAVLFGVANQE